MTRRHFKFPAGHYQTGRIGRDDRSGTYTGFDRKPPSVLRDAIARDAKKEKGK